MKTITLKASLQGYLYAYVTSPSALAAGLGPSFHVTLQDWKVHPLVTEW
jgi:hypothetical protein